MATLQKIRNRAGLLIAIIIGLALFSFILSDFLNTSGGPRMRSKDTEIAEIAGKSVSYMEYQEKVDYLTEINTLYSGQSTPDEQTIERIRTQTWEQILRNYILEDEYNKLGISVHPDELFDMVQGRNVHPYIRQLFTDPNTGQFNQANVLMFLKNMDQDPNQKAYWLFLEKEMINERKFAKYNNLIAKGLYTPTEFVTLKQAESDKISSIEYIVQRFSNIPDSLINISQKDIKDYYNKHKENYKQEAARDIECVVFDIVPSVEDDRIAQEWINKIYSEFEQTEDDKDFVNYNSDITFDDKNYKDGELSEIINDFMFSAKVGDIRGPYFENDAYKISKLHEINYLPDSVKSRHILIDAGQTQESDKAAKNTADSLKELILKGADFVSLAKNHSIDPGSKDIGGDLGWFQEGTMVKPFNDTAFSSNMGDVKIARTQFGYHIIQLQDIGKKVKKAKVASLIRLVEPSTETYQYYYSKASNFQGNYNTYEKFQDGITTEGLTPRSANDIKETDEQIPGLETSREIVRWAYNAELHDISTIFELGNKYVVAILTDIKEEGYAKPEDVELMISTEIKKQKKAEKIIEKINEVGVSADLNRLAEALSVTVQRAENIRFTSYTLSEPKVVAAATALPQNVVSEPIIGNNGVYVIKVISTEVPEAPVNIQMAKNSQMMQYQSSVSYGQRPYEALKDLANIKDRRAKFY